MRVRKKSEIFWVLVLAGVLLLTILPGYTTVNAQEQSQRLKALEAEHARIRPIINQILEQIEELQAQIADLQAQTQQLKSEKLAQPEDEQSKQESLQDEMDKYTQSLHEAAKHPHFYGEKLIGTTSPEGAFELILVEGQFRVIRHQKDDSDQVDSSVFSHAFFDPKLPNQLAISISNYSRFPIDIDYYGDRYYVETYGNNIHQLRIVSTWQDYGEAINPRQVKYVWVEYPSTLSQIDIKNILIRLDNGTISIGLQKIPR